MGEIVGVFGIDTKLLIIQAVNFGLLLLILWRFLYRPLVAMIDKRQGVIEQGVKDSEAASEKLSEIEGEKDTILKNATKEGEGIVDKATANARDKEAKLVAEANAKSERILSDANDKAEEIKRLAHEESKSEIARIAVLSAEKILREKA